MLSKRTISYPEICYLKATRCLAHHCYNFLSYETTFGYWGSSHISTINIFRFQHTDVHYIFSYVAKWWLEQQKMCEKIELLLKVTHFVADSIAGNFHVWIL